MGTAAFITVKSAKPVHGNPNPLILGMTMDGFPQNLRWLGLVMIQTAKALRCWTKFSKGDEAAVQRVMFAVCEKHGNWLFIDRLNHAEWVSYSAVLHPITGVVQMYEGSLEYPISSRSW